MIDPKSEPLFNRSPYKRIDLAKPKPKLKDIITRDDNIIPDPTFYTYNHIYDIWELRE